MATDETESTSAPPGPRTGWAAIPLRWKIFMISAPLTILFDQLSKVWARASLELAPNGAGIPRPVIDGFWEWRLSHNPGSAFGLFNDTAGASLGSGAGGGIAVNAGAARARRTSSPTA